MQGPTPSKALSRIERRSWQSPAWPQLWFSSIPNGTNAHKAIPVMSPGGPSPWGRAEELEHPQEHTSAWGHDAEFSSLREESKLPPVRLWDGKKVPEIWGEFCPLSTPNAPGTCTAQAPALPFHIFLLVCAPGPKG